MFARPKTALLVLLLLAGCATARGRQVLYQGSGDEPVVVIDELDGVRTLRFGRFGAIQSAAVPGRPDVLVLDYTRGAMVGLAFVPAPKRVLIVGLGGGTMASYLHHQFPGAVIDTVEIDPEVLSVARRYFGFRDDGERLVAHVEDGRRFVERAAGGYDLIFLDAYAADAVPLHLATREYLALLRSRLAPGGVVVSNLWEEDVNDLYPAMVRAYQVEFDQVWEVEANGNRLVVGVPAPLRDRATLRANARAAAAGRDLHLDLDRLAAAATDITERPLDAEPLSDTAVPAAAANGR